MSERDRSWNLASGDLSIAEIKTREWNFEWAKDWERKREKAREEFGKEN